MIPVLYDGKLTRYFLILMSSIVRIYIQLSQKMQS